MVISMVPHSWGTRIKHSFVMFTEDETRKLYEREVALREEYCEVLFFSG